MTTSFDFDTAERIYSLDYLQQMCGDAATIEDAVLMRDALIDAGYLDWRNDLDGGHLSEEGDREWEEVFSTLPTLTNPDAVAVYSPAGYDTAAFIYLKLPAPTFMNGPTPTAGPLTIEQARHLAARLLAEADTAEQEVAQ